MKEVMFLPEEILTEDGYRFYLVNKEFQVYADNPVLEDADLVANLRAIQEDFPSYTVVSMPMQYHLEFLLVRFLNVLTLGAWGAIAALTCQFAFWGVWLFFGKF